MKLYSGSPERFIEDDFFEELENEIGLGWLIEKLFTRGTIDDVKAIRKYYGDETIKNEVVNIKWLSKELLHFFSGIFEIPKENFLTYRLINQLTH